MSTRFGMPHMNAPVLWSIDGVSAESQEITSMISAIASRQRVLASFRWRDSLLDEVSRLSQNCERQGWDGYDAAPISNASAIQAAQLIELLPNNIQPPDVVPEPSGDISLEWRATEQKNFSLGVSGQSLVYAGIFGGSSKSYGEERFSRELPATVLEILTSYFPEV